MKNILVTGGLGHIGSKLIRELANIEEVKLIRIYDNLSTQRYCSLFDLPKSKKFQFVEADIRDEEILEQSMKDIDTVIHLAAITDAPSTINNPEITHEINFNATKKIYHLAVKCKVKKFMFPSTTSVYGEAEGLVDEKTKDLRPQSPYAESKLNAENYLLSKAKENDTTVIILRLGTIFGTSIGMRFHTAVNKFSYLASMNKPLTVWENALEHKRPYLGLNDAARAFIFLEKNSKNGELYNVLTDNYTVKDMIDSIKKYKPHVKIQLTKSPILNQKSYEVSNKKIKDLNFVFKDNVTEDIHKTMILFEAIKND